MATPATPPMTSYSADSAVYAALELSHEAKGDNPIQEKVFDAAGATALCRELARCFKNGATAEQNQFGVNVLASLLVQRKANLIKWDPVTDTMMNGLLSTAKEERCFLRPGRGRADLGRLYKGVEMLAVAIESAAHHAKVPLSKVFKLKGKEGEPIDLFAETKKISFGW